MFFSIFFVVMLPVLLHIVARVHGVFPGEDVWDGDKGHSVSVAVA